MGIVKERRNCRDHIVNYHIPSIEKYRKDLRVQSNSFSTNNRRGQCVKGLSYICVPEG